MKVSPPNSYTSSDDIAHVSAPDHLFGVTLAATAAGQVKVFADAKQSLKVVAQPNYLQRIEKDQRAEIEKSMVEGCTIPGTSNLSMQAPYSLFKSIQLQTLYSGCDSKPNKQPKPLKIDIEFKALAHIASAPGRIDQIKDLFKTHSLEGWLQQSFNQVDQNLKTWTLHQCPDTDRKILTIFETPNTQDTPQKDSLMLASRFILSNHNPARVVTGFPLSTADNWLKAGVSIRKTPLQLVAAHGVEQLEQPLRTSLGIDLAFNNAPRSQIQTVAESGALSIDTVSNDIGAQDLDSVETSNKPTVDHTSDNSQTAILNVQQAHDKALLNLSLYEVALNNFESHSLVFHQKLQAITTQTKSTVDLDLKKLSPTDGYLWFRDTMTDEVKASLNIIKEQAFYFEDLYTTTHKSLNELDKAKDKAMDVHKELLEPAAMINDAQRQGLRKTLKAMESLKMTLQHNICKDLSNWLTPQTSFVIKMDSINNRLNALVLASHDLIEPQNHESQRQPSDRHKIQGGELFFGLIEELTTNFDPGVIVKDFDLKHILATVAAIHHPAITRQEREQKVLHLSNLVLHVPTEIMDNFTSYLDEVRDIVKWTNAQIKTCFKDAANQQKHAVPLIPLAGALARSFKTLQNLNHNKDMQDSPAYRRASYKFINETKQNLTPTST